MSAVSHTEADQTATAPAAGKRYEAFDAMRGIAAISIATWHANQIFGNGDWLGNAYLAVDMFFALSGFVLAHAYESRLANGMTALQFTRLRIIRFYPLYLLGLLFSSAGIIGLWAIGHPGALASQQIFALVLPSNLLMLPAPPDCTQCAYLFPLNAPAWSLFFELLINIAFAIAWRWLSYRVLIAICATAASLLIYVSIEYSGLSVGWSWPTFAGGLARVCFSFPAGVLIYRVTRQRQPIALNPWLLCSVLLLLLCMPISGSGKRALYDALCVIVAFPMLIAFGGLMTANMSTRSRSIFRLLGDMSYALYAVHWPLLTMLAKLLTIGLVISSKTLPSFAIPCVVIVVAASWVIDRTYDTPLRRWLGTRNHKVAAAIGALRRGCLLMLVRTQRAVSEYFAVRSIKNR